MTQLEALARFSVYVLGGVVYAASGYFSKVKRDDSVTFNSSKFARTVIVGAVAGAIAVSMGDNLTDPALAAAMGIAIPVVDELLNAAGTLN